MMINISLTGMDLATAGKDGVMALVNACTTFAGASLGTETKMPDKQHKVTTGDGSIVSEKVHAGEPGSAKPAQTASAPIAPSAASETTVPAAPVAPATPAPTSVPPAAVPTAVAPTYTVEELQVACAPLLDAGHMADLQQILTKFGATSLLDVPKERYGALAAELRTLGARL